MKAVVVGFCGVLIHVSFCFGMPDSSGRIEGIVLDSAKKPVPGAEVHIQAKDGSVDKFVRTDASGRYAFSKLPETNYELVLLVNRSVKANINNATASANKSTQVNFRLTGQMAENKPARKHTHMVYVPAETGSNLGGRWVEVEDNGDNAAAMASSVNLKKAGNATLRQIMSDSGQQARQEGGGPGNR